MTRDAICAATARSSLLSTRGLERAAREALMAFVRAGGGLFDCRGAGLEPAVLADDDRTGSRRCQRVEQRRTA